METTGQPESAQRLTAQRTSTPSEFRAILLPIKDLQNAKQRLAGVLTPEERFGLAQAMLADTIRALCGVQRARQNICNHKLRAGHRNCRQTWLGNPSRRAPSLGKRLGRFCLAPLRRARSHGAPPPCRSIFPSSNRATSTISWPPNAPPPAVVMVPSRDGTGTNAILRTPPTLFPSHFGPNSFAKHRSEAERAGAKIIVRRNERLEMDVDDEADLRALLRHDLTHTATGKWLEESGVAARFRARAIAV